MPATSTIISCPAGQWTSVAQRMDLRTSLMVQCPELPTTTSNTFGTTLNGGVAGQVIAADPLRARLVIFKAALDASTASYRIFPGADGGGGMAGENGTTNFPASYDTGRSQLAQAAWSQLATGAGTHAEPVQFIVETYQCVGLILGITTAAPTYTGPYGVVPPGIWLAPDLAGGPTIFRLSTKIDGELTIQEWFAWPVGTGDVNAQVYEVFDPPPTPETQITVAMPALSPHGKQAAIDLLAAMRRNVNDEDGRPNDA